VTIDITSFVSGYSAVTSARALLLEGSPEVHQLLAVLVDLSLEFVELLKLGPLRPLGGKHRGPPPMGAPWATPVDTECERPVLRGWHPRGYLLDLHVKAFM
jgi:hypothetical protein